jgi:hypothetical protein
MKMGTGEPKWANSEKQFLLWEWNGSKWAKVSKNLRAAHHLGVLRWSGEKTPESW